jgi:uncharacterized membrane protein
MSLPSLARVSFRGLTILSVLALLVTVTSGAGAQTPTALQPLDGDSSCTSSGINNRGEVAGTCVGVGGGFTALVWDRSGTPRALPPLDGGTEAVAQDINARGEVAGFSVASGGGLTAVV